MSEFDKYWSDLESEFGHIRSPANRFAKKVWDKKELKISQLEQQLQEELDQDSLKGYPTVIEWKKTIEKIKTMVKE
jgi:hypothetical protein